MKVAMTLVAAMAIAAPARAQHVHDQAAQLQRQPPAACARTGAPAQAPPTPGPGQRGPQTPPIDVPWNDAIPAGTADHAAKALKDSPRHGEWADIKLPDGTALKSWVVYPEKATKTGVVIVIHDINGMRDITRAVGDQLAQDGFIAIVPDFLSGKGPNGGGTASLGDGRRAGDSGADPGRRQGAAGCRDGLRQEASGLQRQDRRCRILLGRRASFGVCGGAAQPQCGGRLLRRCAGRERRHPRDTAGQRQGARARTLCRQRRAHRRHGSGDEAAMKKLGKSYEVHTFEGAGHGFMGNQAGAGGSQFEGRRTVLAAGRAVFHEELEVARDFVALTFL